VVDGGEGFCRAPFQKQWRLFATSSITPAIAKDLPQCPGNHPKHCRADTEREKITRVGEKHDWLMSIVLVGQPNGESHFGHCPTLHKCLPHAPREGILDIGQWVVHFISETLQGVTLAHFNDTDVVNEGAHGQGEEGANEGCGGETRIGEAPQPLKPGVQGRGI